MKAYITNLKKIVREPVLLLAILVLFYLLITFVVFPLFQVFKTSLSFNGEFGFGNYIEVLKQSYYIQPLLNSLLLATITASIGTVIGFIFAYAITRTPMRFKGIFRSVITLPIVSPPFVVALACILLFGRSGIFAGAIGNIYGLKGLVLVEVIAYTPTAFLSLVGVLKAIDPALEEAGYDLGASRLKVFRTVTLPLATPGLVSAWLLVFIQSIADFGNPMVLSGDFSVLSVQAYLQITGMYDLSRGATLAILLLVPTVAAFYIQKHLLSKKSYVTVTGKPTSATIKNLEWYIKAPVYTISALFAGLVILLYGMVVWGSFQKLWGVDASFTLNNYIQMWKVGKDYIIDSLILASVATPIAGLMGMFIAYLTTRKQFPGRNALNFPPCLPLPFRGRWSVSDTSWLSTMPASFFPWVSPVRGRSSSSS